MEKPKKNPLKKYGRTASTWLNNDIYAQIEQVKKVIDASRAGAGNISAKGSTALRHSIIIGLSVIEMMGDGYISPQHTIDAIKSQKEVYHSKH